MTLFAKNERANLTAQERNDIKVGRYFSLSYVRRKKMMKAFERISQGLQEAITHASGEEVEGVILHTPKIESNVTRHEVIPIAK